MLWPGLNIWHVSAGAFCCPGSRAPAGGLAARALAGACAQRPPKPVAFFSRKGGDCLGKFSREAERTLRLLLEVARLQSAAASDPEVLLCPCIMSGVMACGHMLICCSSPLLHFEENLMKVASCLLHPGCECFLQGSKGVRPCCRWLQGRRPMCS